MTGVPAAEARNLTRTYGRPPVAALREVSLTIEPGELFGLLGPNGAGKTSLVRIFSTVLAPSAGQAFVLGHDVSRDAKKIRARINVIGGGDHGGYGMVTVEENLWLYSQFYGFPGREARLRIGALIEAIGLKEHAKRRLLELSKGQQQRVNIARGLLNDPELLLLDEPTAGLDVISSRQIRQFFTHWLHERPDSRTILLTTHYMHEAEELCSRIAIIDQGKILACDTTSELKSRLQRHIVVVLKVAGRSPNHYGLRKVRGIRSIQAATDGDNTTYKLTLLHTDTMSDILDVVTQAQGRVIGLQQVEPSLEEVFVNAVRKGSDHEEESVLLSAGA